MEITFDEAVEQYQDTYLAMENDPRVQAALKAIAAWEERLEKYRGPYEKRLALYEDVIKEHVVNLGESIKQGHLHVVFYKPRRSTSWKSVAQDMDAPQELIDKHTKIGEPSARIKWNMNGG